MRILLIWLLVGICSATLLLIIDKEGAEEALNDGLKKLPEHLHTPVYNIFFGIIIVFGPIFLILLVKDYIVCYFKK